MNANNLSTVSLRENGVEELRKSTAEISTCIAVHANVQRLLYALSLPEYIEAWLLLPGAERVQCHSERSSFDRYRIDVMSSHTKVESIYALCRLCKPNGVYYYWNKCKANVLSRSAIEIRILHAPRFYRVAVKHRELDHCEGLERYLIAWRHSLIRLRSLIEPGSFFGALEVPDSNAPKTRPSLLLERG